MKFVSLSALFSSGIITTILADEGSLKGTLLSSFTGNHGIESPGLRSQTQRNKPSSILCVLGSPPQCGEGKYCRVADGDCAIADAPVPGTCVRTNVYCGAATDDVCGCDGNTYHSRCHAQEAGANVMREGACAPTKTGPQPRHTKVEPLPFQPAVSLDEFKSVDATDFEWVNKQEIGPGQTTCGFLHAPLGSLAGVTYPMVNVYVCVKFAAVQPAPRGNMAVHCGGPGALSDCIYLLGGDYIGRQNAENYNVIAFDQRGMGRSSPTFVVEECKVVDVLTTITNQTDFADEATMTKYAEGLEEDMRRCWNYEGFRLKVEGCSQDAACPLDEYHFLEHSGTRQLAEDIERVRMLFGDTKLTIAGVSYGTKVMGTYATLFPHSVQLMVLDGNDDPDSDILANADDIARTHNQRIEYYMHSCKVSEECDTDDMQACFDDIALHGGLSYSAKVSAFHSLLSSPVSDVHKVCRREDVISWAKTHASDERRKMLQVLDDSETNSASKPTTMSDVWPFSNYKSIALPFLPQHVITGQDFTFGAYTTSAFAETLANLNRKYSGQGKALPVFMAGLWYQFTAFWPNDTPLSPIGNPFVPGIIAGQMFDPSTPYLWTMKMRDNFKSATLVTSRSSAHGLNAANDLNDYHHCLKHIRRYLESGIIDIVDGQVCASKDITASCTKEEILNGKRC